MLSGETTLKTMVRKSQTATEYLIILAVVIVIALVVVNTMGGFPGIGAGSGKKVSDLKLATDTVGIESYNIGTDSSLFKLKNNYYDTITVTSFRVNNQSSLTCNSSNTNPTLPIVLNVGQSMIINCTVVNTSTYTLSTKQTPLVGITYTDNMGATRSSGNEGSSVATSVSQGEVTPPVAPDHSCGELSTSGYTIISNCDSPISVSGNYILTQDLSCPSQLTIAVDDVNINGNYCTITGDINSSRFGQDGEGNGLPAYTNLVLNNLNLDGTVISRGGDQIAELGFWGNGAGSSGTITIRNSSLNSINSFGGTSVDYRGPAGPIGRIILIDSTVGSVFAKEGNGCYTTSGTIDVNNSEVSNLIYESGDYAGCATHTLGSITVYDSNITSIKYGKDENYVGWTEPAQLGPINIFNSNIVSISATQGEVSSGYNPEIGPITVTNSNITSIKSVGGIANYWGGRTGAITVINSIVNDINSSARTGTSGGGAGSTGEITIIDSTVQTIFSGSGTNNDWSLGTVGTISVIRSVINSLKSIGGDDSSVTSGYGEASPSGQIIIQDSNLTTIISTGGNSNMRQGAAAGAITITGASTHIGSVLANGGNSGGVEITGGAGGDIAIIPTCPNLANIGTLTCLGGTGDPNGANGTCTKTCS